MNAERRYKTYNSILNWLVIFYAFSLIAIALVALGTGESLFETPLILLLNIATFTTACMTFAGNFSGKASEHRECYLRLDRLNSDTSQDVDSKYHELLAGYQNHHQVDYLKILVDEKILRKRTCTDSKGVVIKLSRVAYLTYFLRKAWFWLVVAVCFAIPFLIIARLIVALLFQGDSS
ncbi:hypothetical protein GCM10007853_23960 [Algimonas ampicilliniresistens]|uniref:SMODS and SLOG-associating 2TM effector domain-containing protein n=2 Tax=Algimonas ampicilliniresistens TaxID=1298735 RepID=A0ABQ5VBQ7_9PROT|nr:hypothetical protein GCM10007853_23960 [Algimonas ampicilliniresistens]